MDLALRMRSRNRPMASMRHSGSKPTRWALRWP